MRLQFTVQENFAIAEVALSRSDLLALLTQLDAPEQPVVVSSDCPSGWRLSLRCRTDDDEHVLAARTPSPLTGAPAVARLAAGGSC